MEGMTESGGGSTPAPVELHRFIAGEPDSPVVLVLHGITMTGSPLFPTWQTPIQNVRTDTREYAVLGWRAVPAVLLIGAVSGTIIALPAALKSDRGMQLPIPFGVFLGIGFLAVLFFGQSLGEWWLRVFMP